MLPVQVHCLFEWRSGQIAMPMSRGPMSFLHMQDSERTVSVLPVHSKCCSAALTFLASLSLVAKRANASEPIVTVPTLATVLAGIAGALVHLCTI